ncbi:hypothetical protein [Anaeromassilibacillus sp. An200]|uniref:hypothetical protein n=1 Tax=Anaeromassilibacillus sp. An200 TaxID=1965587 RepID=UPI000B392398|nr:hypothetical protein [Anaeromassilibacillus sp. An200]OUP07872.1 hypothetical protein B5F35_14040 [Anaeromassilibacillus sp. An200]
MLKKKHLLSLLLTVICIFSFTIPISADSSKASDQISAYLINVDSRNSAINVKFSVIGDGIANKLGCESIDVYKQSGSQWVLSESKDEYDTGMSQYNSFTYTNTIYCNAEAGARYKVVVTVFAENDAGRDTRSKTVYVTGK